MDSENSQVSEDTGTVDISPWQRLSPIAIIYFATRAIRMLIGNVVYMIPALAVGYKQITENPHVLVPGLILFASLLLLYAVLNYLFYQFRLAQDSVEIRSGVFSKKHINLPFSRIQNITLEQPIYYRITGYVCLELDTAGSAKQEAKIVAMPLQAGEDLKQDILNKKRADAHDDNQSLDNAAPDMHAEQVINQRSVKDLVIHGITNNRVWIILGATAPFFDNASRSINTWLKSIGVNLEQLMSSQSVAWWQFGLYAISLTMIIMLLLALVSVAGSILVFYGFTLSKTEDRYVRRSGLLTRQEVSMKLSRMQMIVRKQDWLDVLLGRINLQFEQNNSGVKGANEMANTNKILVPSVKEHECQTLINDAYPENKLSDVNFSPISKRFLIRMLVLWVLPLTLLLGGLAIYHQHTAELFVVIFGAVLVSFLVFMRWYRWGYAHDQQFVYVRKGLLGIDYYCFPIYKVQQTQFKQSVLMRRRNLASCKLVLASGGITIPFISALEAYKLINKSLYKVESEKRSWM